MYGLIKRTDVACALPAAEKFLFSYLNEESPEAGAPEKSAWQESDPALKACILSYFAEDRIKLREPGDIFTAADHLAAKQQHSGGYRVAGKDELMVLDAGLIARSFAVLYQITGKAIYLEVALRASLFVCAAQRNDGGLFSHFLPTQGTYSNDSSDVLEIGLASAQAESIESLMLMSAITGNKRYVSVAAKLAQWVEANGDFSLVRHGARCLIGLWAYGRENFVKSKLQEKLIPHINDNGFIASSPRATSACVAGSLHLAILLFKAAFFEESRRILDWARVVQLNDRSGGLAAYANADASCASGGHLGISAWATLYFAELERLWR